MKIITILFFSTIIYFFTFSHIDSSGLFSKKACQCATFNVLANYYHKFEIKHQHGKKCNISEVSDLAQTEHLANYYSNNISQQ